MGLFKSFLCGLVVLLSASCGLSQAATISQTFNFSDTQTASGTGRIVHATTAGIIATDFDPFNISLGTLQSFAIDWTATVTASGVTSSSGGSLNTQLGGTLYIATDVYDGTGNSNGNGSGPNTAVGPVSATINKSNLFLVSNSSVTYNPALLATVIGGSPFSITYSSPSNDTIYTGYSTMASITSSLTGSVTLTYNYDAATVPEPTSFAIGSILCMGLLAMRRRTRQRSDPALKT